MPESRKFEVKRESLEAVQKFISEWAENKAIPLKIVTKVNICCDEIVSNVVFYSGATFLELTCAKVDSELSVTFVDDGKAFDPLKDAKEPDITANAEERMIGGLGIFMVKKMMKSVTYERVDNTNVFKMVAAIN